MESETRELERISTSLRESEGRFRDLFDRAPVGYYECNSRGNIIRVNQTALALLGYSVEEILGRPEWAFVVEHETARHAILDRLAGTDPTDTIDRNWKRSDGSLMPAMVQYQVLRSGEDITGLRATIQDITAYKQIEEQLRYAQKLQTIGQLAGGVAHEFNNLLQVVSGYSEVALDTPGLDPPVVGALQEIHGAVARAVVLTRRLLAFSQRQTLSLKIVDLNQVVGGMNEMILRTIGENIELVTIARSGIWSVKADPGQMEQVILNLVLNARDAMPSGGKLVIETSHVDLDEGFTSRYAGPTPGPHVMLAVTDTGGGMAEETLSHLFEPFFTTKGFGKGIGLGLATVHGIVSQSGGCVDVLSQPGKGSTFRVYLPRTQDAPTSLRVFQGQPPRRSETILVVEDEDSVRTLMGVILRESGHTVLEARHGIEALRIDERHHGTIHMVVADLLMPHMGGAELAEHLKARRPNLKVICISGKPSNGFGPTEALPEGATFLAKPFRKSEFLGQVHQVLDSD